MLVQIALAFLLLYLLFSRWQKRKMINLSNQLKSGYPALPIIGHSYLLFGNDNVVADPEIAEVVLKTCLEKDDIVRFVRSVTGNGSIFAPVSIWRPRRKIIAPTFSLKNLYHFVEIFSRESIIMTEQMRKMVASGPVSMWKYFSSYSMDSVFESTLGVPLNAQKTSEQPFLQAWGECCRLITARIFRPWLYSDIIYKRTPQYKENKKHIKVIQGFIEKIITNKLNQLESDENISSPKNADGLKTFLELLIETSSRVGNRLNSLELREEALVLVLAGTDTSAVGASFTTVMLSKHPCVQEKIYQELQEVFGDSNRPVTAEDLPRLKYLEATIKEPLRLYPPVPLIVRKVEKDFTLPSGLTVVEGCGIIVSVWSLHRNRKYWGEDVDQFKPERFIDSPPKHPAAFIPFSHGSRSCLVRQPALGQRGGLYGLTTLNQSLDSRGGRALQWGRIWADTETGVFRFPRDELLRRKWICTKHSSDKKRGS